MTHDESLAELLNHVHQGLLFAHAIAVEDGCTNAIDLLSDDLEAVDAFMRVFSMPSINYAFRYRHTRDFTESLLKAMSDEDRRQFLRLHRTSA